MQNKGSSWRTYDQVFSLLDLFVDEEERFSMSNEQR